MHTPTEAVCHAYMHLKYANLCWCTHIHKYVRANTLMKLRRCAFMQKCQKYLKKFVQYFVQYLHTCVFICFMCTTYDSSFNWPTTQQVLLIAILMYSGRWNSTDWWCGCCHGTLCLQCMRGRFPARAKRTRGCWVVTPHRLKKENGNKKN